MPFPWIFALVALCACSHNGSSTATRPRPTTGSISGIANDRDSGDPIAKAQITVRAQGEFKPLQVSTMKEGIYSIDNLKPGKYSLSAVFANQPIEVSGIEVHAGEASTVDLVFTLGDVTPITYVWGDASATYIRRYKPRVQSQQLSIIEGTVNDLTTKLRVAGAVVSAVATDGNTLQTVSDDSGHYRLEGSPSTYAVSAYYAVGGHGQIEVRRSDVTVAPGEAVVVPLWIALER